jgi:lipopolysaccharide biosynthesis glycosyltransferase
MTATTLKMATTTTTSEVPSLLDRKLFSLRHILYAAVVGSTAISIGINFYQLHSVHEGRMASTTTEDWAVEVSLATTTSSSSITKSKETTLLRRETFSTVNDSHPKKPKLPQNTPGSITKITLKEAVSQKFANIPFTENRLLTDPQCTTEAVQYFCSDVDNDVLTCMDHQVEIPPDPLSTFNTSLLEEEDLNCKTLWFAGFHQGDSACPENGTGYATNYAAALSSALENAKDVLQPVLMLGRYGLAKHQNLSTIGQWAQDRGAHVVVVPELSFQDQVHVTTTAKSKEKQHSADMGPFLRLDIPLIIEQHRLFDQPGICQQYILYTDADVIFPNPVTRLDVALLKRDLRASKGEVIVSYGRESGMEAHSFNTGVMVMDAHGFQKEWPHILEYATAQDRFPAHDQILLNKYFSQSKELQKKRIVLSLYWNWKPYWKLEPSSPSQIKAIHFHGPKLQKGLEEMGNCDIAEWERNILPGYHRLFKHGVCCDYGKTAKWAMELFNRFHVSREVICEPRVLKSHPKISIFKESLEDAGQEANINTVNLTTRTDLTTSPTSSLPVHSNCTSNSKMIADFCSTEKIQECMIHKPETLPEPKDGIRTGSNSSSSCKTLWFASFHEGEAACPKKSNDGAGYAIDYSAALASAVANAGDTLQPILLLGRYGLDNENSTELSKVGKWAQDRGARVIVVPRLSFQDDVDLRGYKLPMERFFQSSMGPFMRLDIPNVIHQHNLFDEPGICQQHVLYTDSDVIFASRITLDDMNHIKSELITSGAIVSYGREFSTSPTISNTGVMLMDVPAFESEWASILQFAKRQEQFPGHDQLMLNSYFRSHQQQASRNGTDVHTKHSLLSIYWNWKAYWNVEPSHHESIKVLHFHGPKPGKGLEEMAMCQTDMNAIRPGYRRHVSHAICCDQGKTANWALRLLDEFAAPRQEVCPTI